MMIQANIGAKTPPLKYMPEMMLMEAEAMKRLEAVIMRPFLAKNQMTVRRKKKIKPGTSRNG